MKASERVLSPGVNFTNRGELKYARAVHLGNDLKGRIDEWSAAETLLARIHQPDEHTVEFRMVVRREPPIEEWSLILGDALHNLRSAFDNVIWALATLDGAQPRTPTRVTFPLTSDENQWIERVQSLETVPQVFLERIRSFQPWAENVPLEESMLWFLHHFDIVDKHRGLISSALRFRQLSTPGLDLNFHPTESAADALATYTQRKTPLLIEDDAALTTITCETHEMRPDPDYLAVVAVQFAIEWGGESTFILDTFLRGLFDRTRQWFDLIYGGELYAKARIQARQSTGANVTMGYEDETGLLHITHLPMTVEAPGPP